MYKVTGKDNGILWGVDINAPIAKFRNGVAMVSDKQFAQTLKDLGYIVDIDDTENTVQKRKKKNDRSDN